VPVDAGKTKASNKSARECSLESDIREGSPDLVDAVGEKQAFAPFREKWRTKLIL